MSREIKFRAWEIKNNCMVDWEGITGHSNTMYKILCFPEPDFILMQFSGLHDKNGAPIYEGDIVKHISHIEGNFITTKYETYEVIWLGTGFTYRPI